MALLFSNGFEEGVFVPPWTDTNAGGGTVEVETANPHHGTYDFKSHLNGAGTWQRAEVYKSIGAGNTVVYARHYEKLTALPSDGNFLVISAINQYGGSGWDVRMQIRNVGGQYQLGYRRYRPSDATNYGNISIAINEYHCFEVYMKKDASQGEVGVYFDGNLIVSESGLDTSGAYLAYYACGSRTEGWNCGGADFYLDCVVVADAYIGVEGGAVVKEVTDSLSLSDSVIVNKTLTVTDSLSLADSVLRDKPLVEVLDSLSLVDVVLVNKTMTVSDVLSIADQVSVDTGVPLKEVLDTLTLQDLITVDKALQVSDSLTLQDFIEKVGEILLNKTKLDKTKLDKAKRDK